MGRALTHASVRLDEGCRMVFSEGDGSPDLGDLECAERSWLRVERWGRWWRLAGRDRWTGELVMLPDTTP